MIEGVFFYLFTGIMLAAALAVVMSRQPIYSVLSLLVVMFCLAALFVMLGAYFVAALQVLLYAGAVLVLFLFVIMLLNLQPEVLARTRTFTLRISGVGTALLFLYLFTHVLILRPDDRPLHAVPVPDGSVEAVARLLFTDYLVPFELASFLILAAIIGAVVLSRQRDPESK